jgi:serine protease AprX
MTLITINGVSVDPDTQAPQLRSVGLHAADATGSNYIVVQTLGPLGNDQRAQLEAVGVVIHEYAPENAYICGFKGTDLDAIRAMTFVTWANIYLTGFKIPPGLRSAPSVSTAEIVPTRGGAGPNRKPRQIDLVFHDDVSPRMRGLKARVAAAAGLNTANITIERNKIRITVEEGKLDNLAALDEIHHIEPVPTRQLFNNVARQILRAQVVVNGTSYRGKGQVIAVADTGLDKGSIANVHPAFKGRVKKLYALGRTAPAKANDPHGHGTHVAGSVLGSGTSRTMGGKLEGTAPEATLVFQSTLDASNGLGGLPNDLHDLFEPPYLNDGARVHTNSWGAVTPGLPYDASSREIDDVVWNKPDLVICFAAGNDGIDANRNGVIDAGSVGSQSAAKNCITVGASESVRNDFNHSYGEYWSSDFPAEPIKSDRQANNADGLVAFSSRGPTKEQRIKPDVVAPGTCILSALSRDVVIPSTDFGSSSDSLYFFDSGTSMATPLVAGCAAVVRESLVRNGMPTPPAALVKALLINGAVELAGQYVPSECGATPNNNLGFGRVDLAGSIILPGPGSNGGLGKGGPLKQGAEKTFTVNIPESPPKVGKGPKANGLATFKMTLVWTDPPGAALQNDLDLVVTAADGTERHGNMGTGAGFDRLNNVEQVWWRNMPPGPAKIVVRAFRITKFAQPYAYAWRIS